MGYGTLLGWRRPLQISQGWLCESLIYHINREMCYMLQVWIRSAIVTALWRLPWQCMLGMVWTHIRLRIAVDFAERNFFWGFLNGCKHEVGTMLPNLLTCWWFWSHAPSMDVNALGQFWGSRTYTCTRYFIDLSANSHQLKIVLSYS